MRRIMAHSSTPSPHLHRPNPNSCLEVVVPQEEEEEGQHISINDFQEMASQNNHVLSPLLKDYCDMRRFSLELATSIHKARNLLQCDIKLVLKLGTNMSQPMSEKVTKMLHDFRYVGSLIEGSLSQSFNKMDNYHRLFLQKLKSKMDENEKELNSLRMWYKIAFIMLGALEAALLICALVAIAIALAPKIAGALAILTTIPIMSIGVWIKSHTNHQICRTEDNKNIFKKMQVHTNLHKKASKLLRELTLHLEERLEAIESEIRSADHNGGDVVDLIKKNKRDFVNDLDALQKCAKSCKRCINSAICHLGHDSKQSPIY